ncbi:hypothetical protein [Candidimonas nitroreducens]|uniref:hypothetical protein n=1 Tax=Candidimonas nitroreducens TaxID=683354 RepID=UPI001303207E|nr:hypothetical protein [Candidimonas nitroreducens]
MVYLYNGFLQYAGWVDHPDDCPDGCEYTEDAPPAEPWPQGQYPFYLDDGWEFVEVRR